MKYTVRLDDREPIEVELPPATEGSDVEARVDGREVRVRLVERSPSHLLVQIEGRLLRYALLAEAGSDTRLRLVRENDVFPVDVASERDRLRERTAGAKAAQSGPVTLSSQLPGVVRQVLAAEGTTVQRGQPVLTLEAMKMENEIIAEIDGIVETIHVKPGQVVAAREPLARIAPAAEAG